MATSALNQIVDLNDISKLPYTIFDQEIYGGRVAYLKKPKMHGKVTIFPSGKMISVGSKSIKEATDDLQETADTLAKEGLISPVKVEVELRNIVAVIMTEPLALEDVAIATGAIYEPEQFPAAILKTKNNERTYLIFNSGKIVLPGLRSMEELGEAVDEIVGLLKTI